MPPNMMPSELWQELLFAGPTLVFGSKALFPFDGKRRLFHDHANGCGKKNVENTI